MTIQSTHKDLIPRVTLDHLIDRHGAWMITRTFVASLLGRHARRGDLTVDLLSDHLRKDIGLGVNVRSRRHWDVKF